MLDGLTSLPTDRSKESESHGRVGNEIHSLIIHLRFTGVPATTAAAIRVALVTSAGVEHLWRCGAREIFGHKLVRESLPRPPVAVVVVGVAAGVGEVSKVKFAAWAIRLKLGWFPPAATRTIV